MPLDWRDWLFPAAVIALPAAAAFALAYFVGLFLPAFATIDTYALTGLDGAAKGAADISARLAYSVAALLVIAASLGGIAFGLLSLAGAVGWRITKWVAAFGVVFGLGAFSINANACKQGMVPWGGLTCGLNFGGANDERTGLFMHKVAVDHVLKQIGAPADDGPIFVLTAATTMAAGAAVAVLAIALAAQARTGAPEGPLSDLRRRRREVQRLLLCGALILTLAVAATRAFYHWPLGMLDKESEAMWSPVVSAATGYWGLFYSLILASAVGPAALSLRRDVQGFARAARIPAGEWRDWTERVGLRLAPRDAVFSILAAAAPVISGPAMDVLGGLLN